MSDQAATAFISYSRSDSEFVMRLAGDLKAAGANVWLDQLDILPGQLWDRAVEGALQTSPIMVVVLSPAAVESINVMDEVSFALGKKRTIIPILIQECPIPFRLARIQHVDFRRDYTRGLSALLKHLEAQPAQREDEERKAREEDEERQRAAAEHQARDAAERNAREAEESQRKIAEELKAKEEAERKALEEEEADRRRAAAEHQAQEDAKRKAQEEEQQKQKAIRDDEARKEAERKAQAAALAKNLQKTNQSGGVLDLPKSDGPIKKKSNSLSFVDVLKIIFALLIFAIGLVILFFLSRIVGYGFAYVLSFRSPYMVLGMSLQVGFPAAFVLSLVASALIGWFVGSAINSRPKSAAFIVLYSPGFLIGFNSIATDFSYWYAILCLAISLIAALNSGE
jgi:hypothetical protein